MNPGFMFPRRARSVVAAIFVLLVSRSAFSLDWSSYVQADQVKAVSEVARRLAAVSSSLEACRNDRDRHVRLIFIGSASTGIDRRSKDAATGIHAILDAWESGTWREGNQPSLAELRGKRAADRDKLANLLEKSLVAMKQLSWERLADALMKEMRSIGDLPSLESATRKALPDAVLRAILVSSLVSDDPDHLCSLLLSAETRKRNAKRTDFIEALYALEKEKGLRDRVPSAARILLFPSQAVVPGESGSVTAFIEAAEVLSAASRWRVLARADMGLLAILVPAAYLGASPRGPRAEAEKALGFGYQRILGIMGNSFPMPSLPTTGPGDTTAAATLALAENRLMGEPSDPSAAFATIARDASAERTLMVHPDFRDLRKWYLEVLEAIAIRGAIFLESEWRNRADAVEDFASLGPAYRDAVPRFIASVSNPAGAVDAEAIIVVSGTNGSAETGSLFGSGADMVAAALRRDPMVAGNVVDMLALRLAGGIEAPGKPKPGQGRGDMQLAPFLRNDLRLSRECAIDGIPLGAWVSARYATLLAACRAALGSGTRTGMDSAFDDFTAVIGCDPFSYQAAVRSSLDFARLGLLGSGSP
ncbi:MAG: hypothetical protein NT080_14625 [Spirochaetes bacterium]|nr:hypothetical protein [Spirochaetota bacterium]